MMIYVQVRKNVGVSDQALF